MNIHFKFKLLIFIATPWQREMMNYTNIHAEGIEAKISDKNCNRIVERTSKLNSLVKNKSEQISKGFIKKSDDCLKV